MSLISTSNGVNGEGMRIEVAAKRVLEESRITQPKLVESALHAASVFNFRIVSDGGLH